MANISRGGIKISGFHDHEMDFQLIRQLGSTANKGASIGECLHIANQINEPDPRAWVEAFERLAEWQKEDGLERLIKDHVVSGREQLFKASNSFRAAEYYSPCSEEHHRRLGLNAADCFSTAMSAMDLHFENHAIPYKQINLPVYFISPENDGMKRKTLMIVSGFDGTLEEEFLMHGLAGIQRGYNIILFAGPGQMDVFRKYPHTCFEPDFENVVKKVINHFEYRQEIDMHKLALLGISLGGHFATRAACYEPRVKALIANSPILDLHAYISSFMGFDPAEMPDDQDFTLKDLPEISSEEMSAELKIRTEMLLIRFGQSSFKNTFKYLKNFKVGKAIEDLSIPALGLVGESEGVEPKIQWEQFCDILKSDSYEFTDFQGAGTHCQVSNISFSNAVIYDWLDKL